MTGHSDAQREIGAAVRRGHLPVQKITPESAHALRLIAIGHEWSDGADERAVAEGIFQPDDGPITFVRASGRARCRECGQVIPKDAIAVVFGKGSLTNISRAYLHAVPCAIVADNTETPGGGDE